MIPPEWQAARRILLVRLDNLGDVLVTTPAMRAVRESLPQASLSLLTSPVGAQVGRLNPDIDEVITCEVPWVDPWQELPFDPAREAALIASLRERRFDGAIIFTSFRQSPLPAAYLCYLAGIPLRLGSTWDGAGSLLTSRYKHEEQLIHEVERNLALVATIGLTTANTDLVLQVNAEDRVTNYELRVTSSGSDDCPLPTLRLRSGQAANCQLPLVILHPGCTMPARTYPWEQFAHVADLLVEQLGATVVLTGSAAEHPLVEQIQRRMRHESIALAGELPFPQFCALIEGADLLITNNTGPMHIAAALKTPVVALFALTNPPEQWGPWRVPQRLLYHEVPCRICYQRACPLGHECLRLVTPEQVVKAAIELLSEEACISSRKAAKLTKDRRRTFV
ncbi:MAG: glycosyltransferase family 9 protein [Chloroflexaceae bacterium]|nr:glycosyltransferase family 9 protein [Chloroflexaceae bacterium]